jgi:hypothetical protein
MTSGREAGDVADLGDEDGGHDRPDPFDGLDCLIAAVAGQAVGEFSLDHDQLRGVVVQQLEQRVDAQTVSAIEGHLVDQLAAAGPEHVIQGRQDPFFGHHRVDLRFG